MMLSTSRMINNANNNNDMDISEASRSSLRRQLVNRRQSLTIGETAFLEELCIRGNQIEIQEATEKLQDEELFFSDEDEEWNDSRIQVGREAKRGSYASEKSPHERSSDSQAEERRASTGKPNTYSMGSTRRISMLQTRRKSELLGGVWKAHESGIALSENESRKSLLSRHSIESRKSLINRHSLGILQQMQNEAIFRTSRGGARRSSYAPMMDVPTPMDVQPDKSPMMDVQSDNTGRRRRRDLAMSQGRAPGLTRMSLKAPIRSQFRRVSEAGRRSSAFGQLPPLPRSSLRASVVEVPEDEEMNDISDYELQRQDIFDYELQRPVAMRKASVNVYGGQGFEVADLLSHSPTRKYDSVLSHAETIDIKSNSFDESMAFDRSSFIFRQNFPRVLSNENLSGIFRDGPRPSTYDLSAMKEMRDDMDDDDDDSWSIANSEDLEYFDAWKVIEDQFANGYGGGGTLPFLILGTSAGDVDACPHVLSPPLMESLQAFMPYCKASENFWMKYSMVRDGSSMHSFLRHARGSKYTVLAIETVDGEVFGAFTSEPWRKNWNYFGTGESFLWRMRRTRKEKLRSVIDQAQLESEIDVFPYTGENNSIQLCTHDRIAVGGGTSDSGLSGATAFDDGGFGSVTAFDGSPIEETEWGFGITIQEDMLHGTTSPCITFGSPSLSSEHSDGSLYEIINLELWTLSPCMCLEDAEKMEYGKLFLEEHGVLKF